MDVIIRQEKDKDKENIYYIVKSAFEKTEFTDHDEHNLVERLRKSDAFIPELSLVAEKDKKIIGHIIFSKLKVGKSIALALAPLSVVPNSQKSGVGSKLINTGHEMAKELGYTHCIVLGHPDYYQRFGYVPASNYNIKAPFDVPDEAFMVKQLIENTNIEGVVEYPTAFFVNE